MQPYWIPYPGYFRLFARCDVFIVLDNVQFPRRGYVHRNKLSDNRGKLDWITLPIQKAPQSAPISDIKFHHQADELIEKASARFPILREGFGDISECMRNLRGPILPLLIETLLVYTNLLGLRADMVLASELMEESGISPSLNAQTRIIEMVKALGGSEYVNLAGGTELYDAAVFETHGLELKFLKSWQGDYASILQQICDGDRVSELRSEIVEQS